MSEILAAKNVHRVYQDGSRKLHVLNGIDLSLCAGEIMLVFGPSGCGKSTLLHILGALDSPTKGEVLLDGASVYKMNDAKISRIRNERIGFVFQFYNLLGEFTALENVMMPALIGAHPAPLASLGYGAGSPQHRAQSPKQRAQELLSAVGLEKRTSHRPSQLSGGESQRVAIARALMNKPDIVLCDEPTGNLDHDNSVAVFELIKELNSKKNCSFIIVTHEREYAKLFKNVKYLANGKLENN
ncbi:MAG: ABC transporter ATP-binding protein [Candidatus Omnitrophota bacterium]